MKLVDTKIIENFFNDFEIEYFKSLPDKYPNTIGYITGTEPSLPPNTIEREIFSFESDELKQAKDIIRNRIDIHFGKHISFGGAHILKAYIPYRAHTDAVYGEYGIDENNYGSWTLIIPLDDYDSNTILFNEYSFETKFLPEYIKGREPIYKIGFDTRQKYLSHETPNNLNHLSIETIFPWKRNTCFAMSRYKFHGSDNFRKKNLPFKQAIIIWTSCPYT